MLAGLEPKTKKKISPISNNPKETHHQHSFFGCTSSFEQCLHLIRYSSLPRIIKNDIYIEREFTHLCSFDTVFRKIIEHTLWNNFTALCHLRWSASTEMTGFLVIISYYSMVTLTSLCVNCCRISISKRWWTFYRIHIKLLPFLKSTCAWFL